MSALKLNNVIDKIHGDEYDAVAQFENNDGNQTWFAIFKVPKDLFYGHPEADWEGKEIKFKGRFKKDGDNEEGIGCGYIQDARKMGDKVLLTLNGSGEYKTVED